MGALHAGHESLIRAAREENDVVVVSLFVNPAQFNDPRDLEAYPRDERRDAAEIAERHGADILFAPAQDEVYRAGAQHEGDRRGPRRGLRGRAPRPRALRRRLHRRREAVQHGPAGRAYFGQKDAQQVAVAARMVEGPRLPARDRRPAHRAASRTARALQPQRPAQPGGAATGPPALTRRFAGRRPGGGQGGARPSTRSRPSTSPASTRRRSRRPAACSSSPPPSAPPD